MTKRVARSEIRVLLIVPGALARITGGSIYDKRLYDYLRARAVCVDVISLPDLPYFAGLIASLIISPLLMLKLAGRTYDLIIEDGWSHPPLFLFNLFCRVTPRYKIAIIVHQLRWLEIGYRVGAAIARRVEQSALKSSRLIFTVSKFMRREIENLIGDELPMIIASPGCDRQREIGPGESYSQESSVTGSTLRGPERGPVRLLFVGNCARRKGLHHLIRAFSILRDSLLTLDIVGDCAFDPAYTKELQDEVTRLLLGEAVTFHGRVSDEALKSFYAQADLFVMPSSYEGFGIVYAEAMRAGLSIIACDTGPAAEIVSAGENGLLVPHGDADKLADAIRTLAADEEMRRLYGRRSIELAHRLPTWDDTCSRVFESISNLICEKETFD